MLPLEHLQRAFAAHLLRKDVSILRGLIDDDGISSERRMNVYSNNFRRSLCDALAGIYPVVCRLVGSDFFQFLFDRYLRLHPARSGDLRNFGRHLPEFLSGFEAVSTLPYLVDVARLEWAYNIVFHASSPEPFKQEYLAGLAPGAFPDVRFKLGSACRLLRSRYPIFRIWEVNQEGYVGDDHTDLDKGSQSVLVVRRNAVVELWLLAPADATFIDALNNGCSLGGAVEAALVRNHDFDLEAVLAKHLLSGALVVENRGGSGRNGTTCQEDIAKAALSSIDETKP